MANYYSVNVNGKTNKDCAWYYAEPNDAAKKWKAELLLEWVSTLIIETFLIVGNCIYFLDNYKILIGVGVGVVGKNHCIWHLL